MTYGQNSQDADYEDIFDDSQPAATTPATTATPAIDESKFVPIDKYNQLEQQFTAAQPKLATLDKLSQVFSPQEPQYTPEQLAEFQRISQVANAALNPQIQALQQQQEFFVNEALDKNAQELGFEDKDQQESWYFEARRGLSKKAAAGDQQARQVVQTMSNLYNDGKFLQLQSFARQNFQYLDSFAGGMKRGEIRTQQIGHSFSNQPFRGANELTPESFMTQVTELQRAGKWQEAQALQEKFGQQIKSTY